MTKRTDIKKILVIGSGPIVIGQAAEFDYAGSQACQSLREEGYEVVLINSNPATIMTDTAIADRVYIEPLTLDFASRIIYKERPDAVLGSLGGQTGLNLVVELANSGILDEYGVECAFLCAFEKYAHAISAGKVRKRLEILRFQAFSMVRVTGFEPAAS